MLADTMQRRSGGMGGWSLQTPSVGSADKKNSLIRRKRKKKTEVEKQGADTEEGKHFLR